MPQKNIVKTYVKDGFYHVYNRGVEKRTIFENDQDYRTFRRYLQEYLSPSPDLELIREEFTLKGGTFKGVPRQPKNYYKEIELIAFCLMPNHFHLLIKQAGVSSMKEFMQSLLTRYSIYFNRRYDRVGKLFQGHYKAVLVTDDLYLLHLSKYIHLNPNKYFSDLTEAFSSYSNYLNQTKTSWINPDIVLEYFQNNKSTDFIKVNTYRDFVENSKFKSEEFLGELTIE